MSPIQEAFRLLKGLNARLRQYRQVKQTINELRRLTDHELNDIGIGRGDIRAIANGDPTYKRSCQTNSNLDGWV